MEDHGASSSSSFMYDVFLSFRGDTRYGFTSHLYDALCDKGINTFRDDQKLGLGNEMRPTLLEAIERSRILIVVLSKEYATSTWCLDELVKIMECNKDKGRPVIPIFYQVEPSDVRHQRKKYETEMINNHESGRNWNKVQAWKLALSAVADISGEHCKDDRPESDIITKIVEEVVRKLPREPLHIKKPVEFDSRFEEVISLLHIESHDTLCMLCICGEDETEKTSFAVALYNKIFHEFDCACFLANVSEKSKESINGLEDLQRALLYEMDHEAITAMGSTFRGCSEIKWRLDHKRVLLVLDDVDSVEQLESLAGGADWFGPGSRIIITTGDEDVANNHVMDGVEIKKYCIDECELEGMEFSESKNNRRRDMEEGDIVGFDDSLITVINQLKEEDPFRNVVSITGMGGLGKTTLARKIYENNEVKTMFPCRAWSCVSKDSSERRVFLSILSCLKSSTSKYEDLSEEKLKEEVRNCLIRNKYLVVLDDIWEPEVWDKVKDVFPNNNNGSMILITSRNDQVANYTRSRSPHHRLPSLNAEESWELFCRKVFGREECPSDLESIGKSIVERCGGLPLAIITMAGLVAKKERSYIEWSRIKDSVPWYLAEDNTKVMDVLKVSYDNLPEVLKPCFLYFGIYPENYWIVARELIQLWIAEGFIQPKKNRTSKVPKPEDVAEDYLNELVDWNLVQVAQRRSDGGVKICRIHDLLRELCILEGEVNNFLEVCSESTNNSLSNSCRLSFLCDAGYSMSLIKGNQSSTHSLFFFARMSYSDYVMKNFPMLYVLHVARYVLFEEVPYDLKKMIHLKYLRIEGFNSTRDDTYWIRSLYNLETLDLSGWFTKIETICIGELERLRHIYTGRFNVVKLRGAYRKPMWNLQTLTRVLIEPQTMLLFNNGCFPNLTKLGLLYDDVFWHNPHDEPLLWNLHHLRNLRTLKIDFRYGSVSFDEIVFPPNISKITLRNILGVDDCGCMSALGRIPSLRVLKLDFGWVKRDTLNCGAGAGDFPQLRVFHMKNVIRLRRLTLEDGAMPHLQLMVIHHCEFLKEIPERQVNS